MTSEAVWAESVRLRETDPRSAAEYAYAAAMLCVRNDAKHVAVIYAQSAIKQLDKCLTNTLEDCAARNTVIGGIVIPDIFHQAVVHDRLAPLEL